MKKMEKMSLDRMSKQTNGRKKSIEVTRYDKTIYL